MLSVAAPRRYSFVFEGKGERVPMDVAAPVAAGIARPRISFAYRIGVVSLAIVFVLLWAFYFAMVTFIGWMVWGWVTRIWLNAPHDVPPPLLIGPALLGAVAIFFLIKPLFFRMREQKGGYLVLDPQDQPRLFKFVEQVSARLGAPKPTIIEVDCDPNAHARFRRGFWSVLNVHRDELVLRVGLPLMSQLTEREFAGVLAHELTHFTQRSGMRSSYLVRAMMLWFARIVGQRDRADEQMLRMRHARNGLAQLLYLVLAFFIESARGVLWVMMMVAQGLSSGLMRSMELSADRSQAAIAGAAAFEPTMDKVCLLDVALFRTRQELAASWEDRRLPDDLPQLTAAESRQIPADVKAKLLAMFHAEKAHWYDTHPSIERRIKNVRAAGGAGVFTSDAPATRLLQDFETICRRATEAHYASVLGAEFDRQKHLVPTSAMVGERDAERASFEALRRFFRAGVTALRPVLPAAEAAGLPACGDDLTAACEAVQRLRAKLMEAATAAAPAARDFDDANGRLQVDRARGELFLLAGATSQYKQARELGNRNETRRAQAIEALLPFEAAAAARLTASLQLLNVSHLANAISNGGYEALRARAAKFIEVSAALMSHVAEINELGEETVRLRILLQAHNPRQPHAGLVARVMDITRAVTRRSAKITKSLSDVRYPFEHSDKSMTIGRAMMMETAPDPTNPYAVFVATSRVVARFYATMYRSLAVLTDLAERAEKAAGLPDLPAMPAEEPAETDEASSGAKAKKSKKPQLTDEPRVPLRMRLAYPVRALSGFTLLAGLVWLAFFSPSFSFDAAVARDPQALASVQSYFPRAPMQTRVFATNYPQNGFNGYRPPVNQRMQQFPGAMPPSARAPTGWFDRGAQVGQPSSQEPGSSGWWYGQNPQAPSYRFDGRPQPQTPGAQPWRPNNANQPAQRQPTRIGQPPQPPQQPRGYTPPQSHGYSPPRAPSPGRR
jgi:Zn-dependent protease with chaperone function